MRLLFCLCLMLCLPDLLRAGAWQREPGRIFLSFGSAIHLRKDTGMLEPEYGFYGEYGLTPKLTLGIASHRRGETDGHTHAFLRFPLHKTDKGAHLAAEIGLGRKKSGSNVITAGLSWGRGITLRDKGGWVSLDGALHLPSEGEALAKLDATLGLSVWPHAKLMAQLFLEADAQDQSVTVTPSYVRRLKRLNSDVVIGLDWRTGRQAGIGLRLGFWREF